MSSRSNKVYTTSETAPTDAALGDEWHVPSTDILYKRLATSTGVSWVNINSGVPIGSLVSRPATTDNGTMRINSTSNSIEVYYNSAWNIFKSLGNLEATGGTITYNSGYKIHTFISSSAFIVTDATSNSTVEYLVVAGGGAGGIGGGGAGGFRTGIGFSVVSGFVYTITVGGGGLGAYESIGTNGSASSITGPTTIISTGGGAGGYYLGSVNGLPGGSGGGGGHLSGGTGGLALPVTSPVQGYRGGNSTYYGGSGGGGAAAQGIDALGSANGQNGGAGNLSSISGSAIYYAGGGGGGGSSGGIGPLFGSGGIGGGGNGTEGTAPAAATGGAGQVNTGGGGGGRGYNLSGTGGAGGSGIVIIRYPYA